MAAIVSRSDSLAPGVGTGTRGFVEVGVGVDVRWTGHCESGTVTGTPPARAARQTRPITVILRAVPAAARDGRVAGVVEIADTGERVPIRDLAEFIAVLARLADEAD